MKKLLPHLLLAFLVVGCAPKPKIINIVDGKISSNSITLKTDDIKEDCKKECITFTVSSNKWCDCMNQCSQDVLNKFSFGNMNMKIRIEECLIELEEPVEPEEPKEGVMPSIPNVKMPVQPTPPEIEKDK